MDKKKLLRKVYITRKSRINLSDELKHKRDFYKGLIVYYTILIAVMSLLDILDESGHPENILILSLTLTVFTFYVESKHYHERHLLLKHHYIKLDDVYQTIDGTDDEEKLIRLREEYYKLLDEVENHEPIHYIIACLNDDDEKSKISYRGRLRVYSSKIIWSMVRIILIAFPFGVSGILKLIQRIMS